MDQECPNCTSPVIDHPENGCVLAALVQVLRERSEHTDDQLHTIHAEVNADIFWKDIGAIVDRLGDGEYKTA